MRKATFIFLSFFSIILFQMTIFCDCQGIKEKKEEKSNADSINKPLKEFKIIDLDLYNQSKDKRGFDIFHVEQTPAIYINGFAEEGYDKISFKIYFQKDVDKSFNEIWEPLTETKEYNLTKGLSYHLPFYKLDVGYYKVELLYLGRVKATTKFSVNRIVGHER